MQFDATTDAALAAATTRDAWCRALATALGSDFKIVWRTSGDVAVLTLTMAGTLPVRNQQCRVYAQPTTVSCAGGTPTKTRIESSDGTRYTELDRMMPLTNGAGSAVTPASGDGFVWRTPLVVRPPVTLSARPTYIASAAELTWGTISGTRLDSVLNALSYAGGTGAQGILSYSGGAKIPGGLVAGAGSGGHNDWYGNDTYLIDYMADAPAWVQLFIGTPTAARGTDWATTGYFADGRPCSRHTRWTLQYDAQRDKVFLLGNGGMGDDAGNVFPTVQVDAFDLTANDYDAANTWGDLTQAPAAGCGFATDALGNFWQATNNRLYFASQAARTWSMVATSDMTGGTTGDTGLLYDPKRNRLFQLRTTFQTSKGRVLDLNNQTDGMPAHSLVGYTGALSTMNIAAALTYCGDRDSYLVCPYNSTTIYEITDLDNATTFTVSELTIAGTGPSTTSRLTDYYDRFAWHEDLHAVVVQGLATQDVHFFRTG